MIERKNVEELNEDVISLVAKFPIKSSIVLVEDNKGKRKTQIRFNGDQVDMIITLHQLQDAILALVKDDADLAFTVLASCLEERGIDIFDVALNVQNEAEEFRGMK